MRINIGLSLTALVMGAVLANSIAHTGFSQTLYDNRNLSPDIKTYWNFVGQTRLGLYSDDEDNRTRAMELMSGERLWFIGGSAVNCASMTCVGMG